MSDQHAASPSTQPSSAIRLAELEAIAEAAADLMQGFSWSMLQGKVMRVKLAPSHVDAIPRLADALDGWRPLNPPAAKYRTQHGEDVFDDEE